MGIPRGSARLLLDEHRERPFSGTVLQLGRSSVYFTRSELESWAREQRVPLQNTDDALSHDSRLAAQGCMSDETFFAMLGFERVQSCDISEWEGADYILDLNEPVPRELEGRFDAIFETGTIVQIFNLPRVLDNLFRLLKVGGRVIHCAVPSNNHMDLGFYMLSPTFFSDFYTANEWRIDRHYLCEYFAYWLDGRLYSDRWSIYRYEPGMLDALSYGRYGRHQAATYLVATKTDDSTGDRCPQLGQYRQTWSEFGSAGDDSVAGLKREDAAQGDRLAGLPQPLAVTAKRLAEGLRRRLPRRMPAPVARY